MVLKGYWGSVKWSSHYTGKVIKGRDRWFRIHLKRRIFWPFRLNGFFSLSLIPRPPTPPPGGVSCLPLALDFFWVLYDPVGTLCWLIKRWIKKEPKDGRLVWCYGYPIVWLRRTTTSSRTGVNGFQSSKKEATTTATLFLLCWARKIVTVIQNNRSLSFHFTKYQKTLSLRSSVASTMIHFDAMNCWWYLMVGMCCVSI